MSLMNLLSSSLMQPSSLIPQSNLNTQQSSFIPPPIMNNSQSGLPMSPSTLMMMLVVSLLQTFINQFMGSTPTNDTNSLVTDVGTVPIHNNPDNSNSGGIDPGFSHPGYSNPGGIDPGYSRPGRIDPDYNCHGPMDNCPPPPPPPAYQHKILGSAGLFGDPKFGVFSPNLGRVPTALQGFESNIKPGQTVTLLNDKDLGGLSVSGTGVQVDPNNAQSTGIGSATFKSGNDTVTIGGDGSLVVNGQNKGNINDNGLIAPIKLPSGLTVSTNQEIDGANGAMAERFVISNGEYKITAAARKPHPDAHGYLDMNFEELTPNAADNASGYQTSVPGLSHQFGIADLLRLEPGSLELTA